MPSAAPRTRRPQRERRANSRYEDGVDPEDEAALLSGNPALIGQKRKAEWGAAAVFGAPLRIPRRARSSRYSRSDGGSSDAGCGGGDSASARAAAAAVQFHGRPIRTSGGKRQAAAPPDDRAVAELLLGMGELITARTDSPPSSSAGSPQHRGSAWRPKSARSAAADGRGWNDCRRRASGAAPGRGRGRRGGSGSPPPARLKAAAVSQRQPAAGKRRTAVAAASVIAAAAASDKAPSDMEEEEEEFVDAGTDTPAQLPPIPAPRTANGTTPLGPAAEEGGPAQRSRLAGPVAPTDGFDETLSLVHQVKLGSQTNTQ